MSSTRRLAIATAVLTFSAGAAIAASQPAETTPVTADFEATVASQSQRQCDANHMKFRVRFEGSQTSSDPRLTGKLVARARSVVNTVNGSGYTTARVRISDPATGRPKFHGHAVGVIEADGGSEGFLTGRTVGPGSTRLLANFNLQQDQATGAVKGELGKATQSGASHDPAVLTNACRGGRGEHGKKKEADRRGGRDDHGRRGRN